jgi:hypothetical protein
MWSSFVQGCGQKEPTMVENPVPKELPSSNPDSLKYANDLDRLSKLSDRINQVCRTSHVVVLGDDSVSAGGAIGVDYGLFDRLSDDGVAVLIAEAMAAKAKTLPHRQSKANAQRFVLQIDEAAGRYVAKAGFALDGFAEWLRAKKATATGLEQNGLPDSTRIGAFMRGYLSAQPNKDKINKRSRISMGGQTNG